MVLNMENNNIEVMEVKEVAVEEIKKENIFVKSFGAIKKGFTATGRFMKKHAGAFATGTILVIGGVVYLLIKSATGEETIVELDDDAVTEIEEDNIVEFDKAANE